MTFRRAFSERAFRAALASNLWNGWFVYGVRVALIPLFVVSILGRPSGWSGLLHGRFKIM